MARKRPVQGSGQRGLFEGGDSENEEKPGEGKNQGKRIGEQVQILGGQDCSAVFRNRKKDREATVQG